MSDRPASSGLKPVASGVALCVRLTPRADRDRVDGWKSDANGDVHLAVRVSAPPVEGAANEAMLAFLSKRWRIPRAKMHIASGALGRLKTLTISGTPEELAALNEELGGS